MIIVLKRLFMRLLEVSIPIVEGGFKEKGQSLYQQRLVFLGDVGRASRNGGDSNIL
jgi:hypothetical protein